jgi:hypothetical protein
MHNAQTDSKQQAINGVEDSLPGYVKEYIFFNGFLVGYKWEKVETVKSRRWYQRILVNEMIGKLKWNW